MNPLQTIILKKKKKVDHIIMDEYIKGLGSDCNECKFRKFVSRHYQIIALYTCKSITTNTILGHLEKIQAWLMQRMCCFTATLMQPRGGITKKVLLIIYSYRWVYTNPSIRG